MIGGHSEGKQLKSSRSEKKSAEGVTYLNQEACLVTLCSLVSTSPEM